LFLLLTGDTSAGDNPSCRLASHEEADFIWWGFPVPEKVRDLPGDFPVLPSMLTRAARLVSDFPMIIVRAGSFTPPRSPYMETGAVPGGKPGERAAVKDSERLWDCGFSIGRLLSRMGEDLVIAESVPGGHETASALIVSLGLDDPQGSQEEIPGFSRGCFSGRGFEAVTAVGDPFQIIAAGILAGAKDRAEIVLAGDIRMLAVAALSRDLGYRGRFRLVTTGFSAPGLMPLADRIGVDVTGMEAGPVQDGAGAGGAVWYAEKLGISQEKVLLRAETLRKEISLLSAAAGE